ncbi:hypothetical protein AB1Y20_022450 [Prymnesium parvum]|uniref:Uncharacterized protein n=1 Tax=Prymnesium parvum TaxID=97485 RepID=A0AB34JG80_PRYPA
MREKLRRLDERSAMPTFYQERDAIYSAPAPPPRSSPRLVGHSHPSPRPELMDTVKASELSPRPALMETKKASETYPRPALMDTTKASETLVDWRGPPLLFSLPLAVSADPAAPPPPSARSATTFDGLRRPVGKPLMPVEAPPLRRSAVASLIPTESEKRRLAMEEERAAKAGGGIGGVSSSEFARRLRQLTPVQRRPIFSPPIDPNGCACGRTSSAFDEPELSLPSINSPGSPAADASAKNAAEGKAARGRTQRPANGKCGDSHSPVFRRLAAQSPRKMPSTHLASPPTTTRSPASSEGGRSRPNADSKQYACISSREYDAIKHLIAVHHVPPKQAAHDWP